MYTCFESMLLSRTHDEFLFLSISFHMFKAFDSFGFIYAGHKIDVCVNDRCDTRLNELSDEYFSKQMASILTRQQKKIFIRAKSIRLHYEFGFNFRLNRFR